MLLSPIAYLKKAVEYDSMAAAAVKPKLKTQHSNWAGYYPFMAKHVATLESHDQSTLSADPPSAAGLVNIFVEQRDEG